MIALMSATVLPCVIGQLLDVLFLGGNELVERRIQEADGYRIALHGLVNAFEVALLHRLQLGQSSLALLNGVGADHLADGVDTVIVEEHVLGTAQADALSAELARLLGVAGSIGIGAYLQLAGTCQPTP